MDWHTIQTLGSVTIGVIIALGLFYLVRQERPMPKLVRIGLWTIIWSIAGTIIGMADREIEPLAGALLGSFWGLILSLVGLAKR